MGRLIDVDKFKADYGMKDDCADCDKELRGKSKSCEFDRVYTKMDFCGWLDDAPTVDAIPIEWINLFNSTPIGGDSIDDLLREWRYKQEIEAERKRDEDENETD